MKIHVFLLIIEEVVWNKNEIICENQEACKKGQSCFLQEAIAASREARKTVFVAYLDVAKAFDSIWINGLFYQPFQFGIRGRLWRMLKMVYTDCKCYVPIQNRTSTGIL